VILDASSTDAGRSLTLSLRPFRVSQCPMATFYSAILRLELTIALIAVSKFARIVAVSTRLGPRNLLSVVILQALPIKLGTIKTVLKGRGLYPKFLVSREPGTAS
jgi:hypothetical protein